MGAEIDTSNLKDCLPLWADQSGEKEIRSVEKVIWEAREEYKCQTLRKKLAIGVGLVSRLSERMQRFAWVEASLIASGSNLLGQNLFGWFLMPDLSFSVKMPL